MSETAHEYDLIILKRKIKTWESDFTKCNKRKPEKDDIRLAPSDIKDAYRKYWECKKKEIGNKEDVWSEKFNKSNIKQHKIKPSNKTLRNFCDKIREKSFVSDEKVNVQTLPLQENLKDGNCKEENKLNLNIKQVEDKLPEFATLDFNDATSQLDDLKFEIKIKNSETKIIKSNNVQKKVKNVNVISSLIHKKLSFESNLDSEWLERCSKDILNNSDYNVQSLPSIEELQKVVCSPGPLTPKRNSTDLQSFINEKVEICKADNESNSQINLDITLPSSLPSEEDQNSYNPFNQNDEINKNAEESTIDSEIKPAIENAKAEEHKKGLKRKLTRNYASDNKLSSRIEKKILTGTLNENFVKINIKKKKFSRGHHAVNVRKLKWKKWKDLKKSRENNGSVPSLSGCFKCGQIGHWARNCKVQAKELFPESCEDDFDDVPLPTVEDAARLAKQSKIDLINTNTVKIYESAQSSTNENVETDDPPMEINDLIEEKKVCNIVEPFYELTTEGKLIETPDEVLDSLKELGYTSFRKGQETAVMRILSGLSTLVVLPTGSGKSLCYQLPAYVYSKKFNCLTLVISPLVSLMEDQVTGLPSCLKAVCLHSGMTDIQKKAVIQDVSDGKVQILLVSPEAVSGGHSYGCGILPLNMPPISFACIDEAHCLSQWSHNFRPSYLQLYKVLTQRLNVKCILGLTATANQSTAKEIIQHLDLKSMEDSVIGNTSVPVNLHVSVSRDKDKDKALIQLLTGERFSSCSSIIIYCIRRVETERLATLIRTCLQDHTISEPPSKKIKSKSKKRNFLWTVEAYHAGLAPPRRRSIQKQFMTGKLRVVIATIAFGMGLDKRDVRAVIHYNMPKSFESYVQEIGRAGRDGVDSHCHLFLDNEGKDIQELQRHIYSNSTDRYVIRKLLRKVFLPCKCNNEEENSITNEKDTNIHKKCPKHEIAFSINECVQELDLKEENISTLLCYLELHSEKWIEVLPPTYATCTIRCYSGSKQLRALASKSPPVAAAYALDIKKGKSIEKTSTYQFNVIEVASLMGWNTRSVKRELKRLEWNDNNRKTGVIVEFSDLSFHCLVPGNLKDDELDDILDFLYSKVVISERKELQNLNSLCSIFTKYSHSHYWACCDEVDMAHSSGIKEEITKYFDGSDTVEDTKDINYLNNVDDKIDVDISDVRSQIRDIIYTNNDQNFTGRAIARIFHGIGSPCYPAEVWGKVRKFWRCLLHINFNFIVKLANEELKKAK